MSRRSLARLLTAIAVVLGVASFAWPDSPEERVLARLETLSQALRASFGDEPGERRERIAAVFRRGMTSNVVLLAPELGTVEGIDALVELATAAAGVDLTLEPSGVHVAGDRARARLLAHLSFRIPGEEIRQKRTATVVLRRAEEEFMVERLEVGPPSHEEPEARP